MKANAPERIYVHKSQYWGLMANEDNTTKDDIEYTRTDAFIEKVAKWLDETLRNTDFYEDEIELMVQDFKKAMKS